MTKKVNEVTEVTLEILKKNPPILKISCKGKVNSSGWSNGKLIPFIYVTPPQDGIYEFDFVADEPSGPSAEVISEIEAEPFLWDDFPLELKSVKVYGLNNFLIKKI